MSVVKRYNLSLGNRIEGSQTVHYVLDSGHQIWSGDHVPTDKEVLAALIARKKDQLKKQNKLVGKTAREIRKLEAELEEQ